MWTVQEPPTPAIEPHGAHATRESAAIHGLRLPVAPRAVLLVRLGAIGDIVFASPLISAFRERFPQTRLVWLCEPAGAELLRANPRLDAVTVWPKTAWHELWRAGKARELMGQVSAFRRSLRAAQFDLAVDLQGLLKSALLARMSGASTRIGLGAREGSRMFMTQVIPRAGEPERMGSEYHFLAERLGLGPLSAMDLPVAASARVAARSRLGAAGLTGEYVALAPFTTRPQKHWFEARWSALIDTLQTRYGLRSVLLGGPRDRAMAARIVDTLPSGPGAPINLAGQTPLGEAAALIADARLVVGVDTGLTHMGFGYGRPTIALFGSTRPYLRAPHPHGRILYHALPCSPCKRRPTCNGRYDCMRHHAVGDVLCAADELL